MKELWKGWDVVALKWAWGCGLKVSVVLRRLLVLLLELGCREKVRLSEMMKLMMIDEDGDGVSEFMVYVSELLLFDVWGWWWGDDKCWYCWRVKRTDFSVYVVVMLVMKCGRWSLYGDWWWWWLGGCFLMRLEIMFGDEKVLWVCSHGFCCWSWRNMMRWKKEFFKISDSSSYLETKRESIDFSKKMLTSFFFLDI